MAKGKKLTRWRIASRDPEGAGKYQKAARRIADPRHKTWRASKRKTAHHLLDMREPLMGYDGGWYDRSELLLIAPFRLLCEFVERELYNPRNLQTDWDYSPEMVKIKQDIDRLYLYWNRDRPRLVRAKYALLKGASKLKTRPHPLGKEMLPPSEKDRAKFSAFSQAEEALQQIDLQMLTRLFEIRGYLWT